MQFTVSISGFFKVVSETSPIGPIHY